MKNKKIQEVTLFEVLRGVFRQKDMGIFEKIISIPMALVFYYAAKVNAKGVEDAK